MSVNERLNDYLSNNGIKQAFVVEKTGFSKDTVSKILNGNRKITADEFLTICEALNISPNMFRNKQAS